MHLPGRIPGSGTIPGYDGTDSTAITIESGSKRAGPQDQPRSAPCRSDRSASWSRRRTVRDEFTYDPSDTVIVPEATADPPRIRST